MTHKNKSQEKLDIFICSVEESKIMVKLYWNEIVSHKKNMKINSCKNNFVYSAWSFKGPISKASDKE